MILHIENLEDSMKKLLDLTNEFSQIAAYKINTQKSVAFLYNSNETSEKEILKSYHIHNNIKNNKILRNTKKWKVLYNENYKTLLKETKDRNK